MFYLLNSKYVLVIPLVLLLIFSSLMIEMYAKYQQETPYNSITINYKDRPGSFIDPIFPPYNFDTISHNDITSNRHYTFKNLGSSIKLSFLSNIQYYSFSIILNETSSYVHQFYGKMEYYLLITLKSLNPDDILMFQIDYYDQYSDYDRKRIPIELSFFIIANVLGSIVIFLSIRTNRKFYKNTWRFYIIALVFSTISIMHINRISQY